MCEWCHERPASSSLCVECSAGTDDIGTPLTDEQVRALGFIPTSRGWVPGPEMTHDPEPPDRIPGDDWRQAIEKRFR